MENFEIDERFLENVRNETPANFVSGHTGIFWGYVNHPVFEHFRSDLHKNGFIKIWHGVVNGDEVMKPFMINNTVGFKKGDRFLCASALHLRMQREKNEKINQIK